MTDPVDPGRPGSGASNAELVIRTGVILPTFQGGPGLAMRVAAEAEAAGVDGVFCFDHLWPLGRPDRPALAPFPLLARVASTTARVWLGPLVARVGLVPDAVLVAELDALVAIAPGRVVAGLGTGDRLSAAENHAYGVPFAGAGERRASLRACIRSMRARRVPVWVGEGAAATLAVAAEEGAAVNLWDAPADRVAALARRTEVTWAGPAPVPGGVGPTVARLADAGATWAVFGWPVGLDELAASGGTLGGVAGPPAVADRGSSLT